MKSNPLVIFAYSFSHKKTFDFIETIVKFGFSNLYVVAAPRQELKIINSKKPLGTSEMFPTAEQLSRKYNLKYLEVPHSSVFEIRNFIPEEAKTAIISGARILKEELISIFEHGIINFHPGPIPQTSGLDSFYWMIAKNTIPGITVHYIDRKVDAGSQIFFHHTILNQGQSINCLKDQLYNSQISALERLLRYFEPQKKCITSVILRPYKNKQMTEIQKETAVSNFENWIDNQLIYRNKVNNCYMAIKNDNVTKLNENYLNEFISYKNNYGRGLLSEACYNNAVNCVKYLIEKKCNVNEINDKGTTPIMYSKSLIIKSQNSVDFSKVKKIINELKIHGADIHKKDIFEKSVFDYLEDEEKKQLILDLINEFHKS